MRFMQRLHDTYVGQVVLVTVLLAWVYWWAWTW